jgi:cold-inducible RNA-binding protein
MARLYVGNIPFTADTEAIRQFFDGFSLTDVKIITDRDTGRQRGFAFVELADDVADAAVKELHGASMSGRNINVSYAKERGTGNSNGGNRNGGGGGGGGGRDRGGRRDDHRDRDRGPRHGGGNAARADESLD